MTRRWRVDMHSHCGYSKDSRTPVVVQARAIKASGLDVVCATDHDTIDGALRLRELADGYRIVIGEEISSADGDIVGLFLERVVPRGLSAEDTVAHVHEQGGLVSIPHPFSRNRRHRIRPAALTRIADRIDLIEILNAREAFTEDNRRAAAWASARGVVGAVGSDAHRAFEIGRTWLEMEPFEGAGDFVAAARGGIPHGGLMNLGVHVLTQFDTVLNRVLGPVRP